MNVWEAVEHLTAYGMRTGLLHSDDGIYARNRILEAVGATDFHPPADACPEPSLEDMLHVLLDYAREQGLIAGGTAERDRLDTKIMGCLTPPPHEVIAAFRDRYAHSPDAATSWFYRFCQDCDYIRRYRMVKDVRWTVESEYGGLEISINLAKPEKDPLEIAAARNAPAASYPKCLLCVENEGHPGSDSRPARQNLRLIPVTLGGAQWYLQYSPYVYYNEHCIVINRQHIPMAVDEGSFIRLFDFLELFPHYFIGSNADLPIVGGSILSHDHFQGGRHEFPMARAGIEESFTVKGFPDVEAGIVKWPLSVIRLRGKDRHSLTRLAVRVLDKWRRHSDESVGVFASTNGQPHNTITPIARRDGDALELDLALRNNYATKEHPRGVFHPHEELHHIKSENIGLIEVMGLAILPPRLKAELAEAGRAILSGADFGSGPLTAKHAPWLRELLRKYDNFSAETIESVLHREVGEVFVKVLECCGVFKRNAMGRKAFRNFISTL